MTVWFENGQKYAEVNHKDLAEDGRKHIERPDGLWTEWYENGQKAEEGKFVNYKWAGTRSDGTKYNWFDYFQKPSPELA